MFTDPITIPSGTFTIAGGYPAAAESAVQGIAFNRVSSQGSQSLYAMAPASLATLVLSKATIRVSHEVTAKSRSRSLFRVDISKLDAAGVEHGVSMSINIDKEAKSTAETATALSRALGALGQCFIAGTGSGAVSTTSIMTDFLNGEC